jgi:hypothetical protein
VTLAQSLMLFGGICALFGAVGVLLVQRLAAMWRAARETEGRL